MLNNARGNSVVGEAARQRILKIASEMGYRPNFASRSLKTRRSRTIGIYVQPGLWRNIGNAYELPIIKGIESTARQENYDFLVLNMSTDVMPSVCAERLAEGRIDGILLVHADNDAPWVRELTRVSDCVTAIDCCYGVECVSRVSFDNRGAVELALNHLASLGHRRIGYAGGCTEKRVLESEREAAFRETTERLGLDSDSALVFNETRCFPPIRQEERFCQAEGQAAMRYFHAMSEPPTAVIAYNSLVALFVLREAQRLGVRVPEELSLIGIDDYEYLHYIDPELTVIDHRLEAMGACGAKLLIDLIERRESAPVFRTFSPKLLQGASCAPVQKNREEGAGLKHGVAEDCFA